MFGSGGEAPACIGDYKKDVDCLRVRQQEDFIYENAHSESLVGGEVIFPGNVHYF